MRNAMRDRELIWQSLDGRRPMKLGDYPVEGRPYWLTMTGVAALGMVGIAMMFAVQ
jgi:hypothetical protein